MLSLRDGDIVGSKHCYRGINQTDAEGDVNKFLFMLADGIRVSRVRPRGDEILAPSVFSLQSRLFRFGYQPTV
jgi:hypothetical protein